VLITLHVVHERDKCYIRNYAQSFSTHWEQRYSVRFERRKRFELNKQIKQKTITITFPSVEHTLVCDGKSSR